MHAIEILLETHDERQNGFNLHPWLLYRYLIVTLASLLPLMINLGKFQPDGCKEDKHTSMWVTYRENNYISGVCTYLQNSIIYLIISYKNFYRQIFRFSSSPVQVSPVQESLSATE